MVLKDYIADQIPYLKTKTVGQKLVKTMQMQLNEESSDEDGEYALLFSLIYSQSPVGE